MQAMHISLVNPGKLSSYELDHFLENGWFRIGAKMFTTTFLTFENQFYNAVWIRIDLKNMQLSKSQTNILKRSRNFRVEVAPFEYTTEKEDLYYAYKEAMPFTPSSSLNKLLEYEDADETFNSHEVCIYDGSKLIACGIFDLGEIAAEGIVSFYHPDYRKYSLGKLLVLEKIKYCKEKGLSWFYPGYVAPGYDKFNYKLEIGRSQTEYLNFLSSRWDNIADLDLPNQPLEIMKNSLLALNDLIVAKHIDQFEFFKYKFYDIGLDREYANYELLSYPYFIHCLSHSSLEDIIIVYNIFARRYQLIVCHKVFKVNMDGIPGFYTDFLLRPVALLAQHHDADYFLRKINTILFIEAQKF